MLVERVGRRQAGAQGSIAFPVKDVPGSRGNRYLVYSDYPLIAEARWRSRQRKKAAAITA